MQHSQVDRKNNPFFLKQLRYDILHGVLRRKKFYLLIAFIATLNCAFLLYEKTLHLGDDTKHAVNFANYLLHMFRGMEVYTPSPDKAFQVPFMWLLINISIIICTLNYPLSDLQGYGSQVLLRSNKRTYWWLSKCFWNVVCIFVAHAVIVAVTLVFTLFTGDFTLTANTEVAEALSLIPSIMLNKSNMIVVSLLLPISISIALSLLQMTLSLYFKRLEIGFISVVVILIASAYKCMNILIGNHLMIIRNDLIFSNGVSSLFGFVFASFISLLSIIFGVIRFNKYDIIK